MEDQQTSQSALLPNWKAQVTLLIILLALFILATYTKLLTTSYSLRTAFACICMMVFGFVLGYRSQPEDRTQRIYAAFGVIIGPCALFIGATNQLTGIYRIPPDHRYTMMLKMHYLLPLLLFIIANTVGYMAGMLLFRRIYPDKAIEPTMQEEPCVEMAPTNKRRYLILQASILIIFACGLGGMRLFPHHATKTFILTALSGICLASMFIGATWVQAANHRRRFIRLIFIISPVAAFVGYYSGSRTHDAIHLIRAIKFSVEIVGVMLIPWVIGRWLVSRRTSNAPASQP